MNIEKKSVKPFEALVNESTKRSVFIASVAYPKKADVRTKLDCDKNNLQLVKTVSSGEKAVRNYLNTYPDHTIGFSIGS